MCCQLNNGHCLIQKILTPCATHRACCPPHQLQMRSHSLTELSPR